MQDIQHSLLRAVVLLVIESEIQPSCEYFSILSGDKYPFVHGMSSVEAICWGKDGPVGKLLEY